MRNLEVELDCPGCHEHIKMIMQVDPQPPFIDREGFAVRPPGFPDQDSSITRSSSDQGTPGAEGTSRSSSTDRVRHFSWTKPLAPGHHHFVQRDDASVPSECGFVVLSEPDGFGGATVFDCNLPASDLVHVKALLDYQAAQVTRAAMLPGPHLGPTVDQDQQATPNERHAWVAGPADLNLKPDMKCAHVFPDGLACGYPRAAFIHYTDFELAEQAGIKLSPGYDFEILGSENVSAEPAIDGPLTVVHVAPATALLSPHTFVRAPEGSALASVLQETCAKGVGPRGQGFACGRELRDPVHVGWDNHHEEDIPVETAVGELAVPVKLVSIQHAPGGGIRVGECRGFVPKHGFGNQTTCANCGSAAAAHQVRAQ